MVLMKGRTMKEWFKDATIITVKWNIPYLTIKKKRKKEKRQTKWRWSKSATGNWHKIPSHLFQKTEENTEEEEEEEEKTIEEDWGRLTSLIRTMQCDVVEVNLQQQLQ